MTRPSTHRARFRRPVNCRRRAIQARRARARRPHNVASTAESCACVVAIAAERIRISPQNRIASRLFILATPQKKTAALYRAALRRKDNCGAGGSRRRCRFSAMRARLGISEHRKLALSRLVESILSTRTARATERALRCRVLTPRSTRPHTERNDNDGTCN
jgi:hypothetical protein